jgi:hypothetical protein
VCRTCAISSAGGHPGLVYGGLVGLGAYLFLLLGPYWGRSCTPTPDAHWYLLLPIIFGVPWVLTAARGR